MQQFNGFLIDGLYEHSIFHIRSIFKYTLILVKIILLLSRKLVNYMKNYLLWIALVIASCGKRHQEKKFNRGNDSLENALVDSMDSSNQTTDSAFNPTSKPDSLDKIAFWNSVVIPTLNHDKETVLSNMDFPVSGHWTQMMKLKKKPNEATREDFGKVYDRFFNSDFLEELRKKTSNDMFVFHKDINQDTTWYSFYVGKEMGLSGGGLRLMYFKKEKKFRLKDVQGVGGNFFAN